MRVYSVKMDKGQLATDNGGRKNIDVISPRMLPFHSSVSLFGKKAEHRTCQTSGSVRRMFANPARSGRKQR